MKWISLEGTDLSGKSTQIPLMRDYLAGKGYIVFVTGEPTSNMYGSKLREMLKVGYVDLMEMTLLLSLDRIEHIKDIKEQIFGGDEMYDPDMVIVLCDRFILSTFAYQIHGMYSYSDDSRSIPAVDFKTVTDTFQWKEWANLVHQINYYIANTMKCPIYNILLDIDEDTMIIREITRNKERDTIEKADRSFFTNVIRGYHYEIKQPVFKNYTVDGKLSVEEVSQQIYDIIDKILED